METNCHDAVGTVKGFLDTISMVDVNIDVQNTLVLLEQFQNGQNAIIDVAKPTSFCLFGMMQPSCPINDGIGLVII